MQVENRHNVASSHPQSARCVDQRTQRDCFKARNGQLRVVDAASNCLPSEQPLPWNQTGPAGPQGPAGPGNTYTVEAFRNLFAGEVSTQTALCDLGDVVIGGYTRAFGVTNLSGDQRFAQIAPIGPAPLAQGWTATATGETSAPDFLDVFAACLHMP